MSRVLNDNSKGFQEPFYAVKYNREDKKLIYVPVDRIWTRKCAKVRNLTLEELLMELKETFNSPYIVKVRWLDEPRIHKFAPYTIFIATLDISGDYFILERADENEPHHEKPKLVIPQFEMARLVNLEVIEIYRKRKTTKEYREERELHEITTW